ncbi:MAG: hypothetical protein QOC74_1328 [Pseudonocardiales bacterium]|nr:hypothetical protein [Pseudonocardiales bacterium]
MRSRLPVGALSPVAIGGIALGALLVAGGPRYPVAIAADGAAVGPAYGVWPLLAVLAVVPAVVSVMLLLVRQRAPGLALIASVGAVSVGQLLLTVQLLLDPVRAARAELVAPAGVGELRPGPGGWLLLAGQLLTVLGGLAAAREASALRGERSMDEPAIGPRTPPGALLLGVGCAVLADLGVLAAPYVSTNPWLVPRSVLDAPVWAAAGGFALAIGIALAVVLACSTPDPRVSVGGLVGAALGVLGVVAPRVTVAALAGSGGLRVALGPVLGVVGVLGLALLACWVGYRGRRAAGRTALTGGYAPADGVGGPGALARLGGAADRLAGAPATALAVRCRLAGAGLTVLAGGCAVAAALTEPLRLAADLPHPQLVARWMLIAAGVLLVPLGVLTATRRLGPTVRPALAVVLVVVPLAAGDPLAALLAVLGLPGVSAGVGLGLMLLSVVLAGAAGLAVVLAGGFERDEVEVTRTPYEGPLPAAAVAAAVLAVPAFWLPLLDGVGWGTTGVLQPPFGLPSWALLAGFAVTAGAALIGPRCRPARAIALFAGVVAVLLFRVLRLAVTPGLAVGDSVGEGAWASGLCLVLVLVAGALVMRGVLRGRPKAVPSSAPAALALPEREEVPR